MTATLGIDIASQAKRTAVAVIRWDTTPPTLVELALGSAGGTPFHDKYLVTAIRNLRIDTGGVPITKTGIDAPFGWPIPFIEAIRAYGSGGLWPSAMDEDRKPFYRRLTDTVVAAAPSTVREPLAVSVDKIGYCAIRTAVLLSDVTAHHGAEATARDGSGVVCEVYPDPSLRHWVADHRDALGRQESYKGKNNVERRGRLLDAILESVPLADPRGLLERARRAVEDDYLDALVCALVARATELGQTQAPKGDAELEAASIEGWIHLPTGSLGELTR